MNTHSQNIPPELVDRMVAFIRRVAGRYDHTVAEKHRSVSEMVAEGVELAALLPTPTDPDLLEARELAAIDNPVHSALYFSGELDADCAQFLTGIKRGRELAGAKTNG